MCGEDENNVGSYWGAWALSDNNPGEDRGYLQTSPANSDQIGDQPWLADQDAEILCGVSDN